MSEIEIIFEKLFNFYKVGNINSLADALKSAPSTVSNWKRRNSISAIKKKCRELGIYNEIFGDGGIQKIGTNNGINSFNNYGEQEQSRENDLSLKFDDDITAILHTVSTVLKASNKDSFRKMIKEWIVENI